jgi:CIC family chloride channel protein
MKQASPGTRAMKWKKREHSEELGDFTTTVRVIPISLIAIFIDFVTSLVACLLLKLIAIFTNLFYYQHVSGVTSSPAGNHLGMLAIAVPVIGSLIVGVIARYGSERIRGHGIPEAIESILMNGSRVHSRLAILKISKGEGLKPAPPLR